MSAADAALALFKEDAYTDGILGRKHRGFLGVLLQEIYDAEYARAVGQKMAAKLIDDCKPHLSDLALYGAEAWRVDSDGVWTVIDLDDIVLQTPTIPRR